MTAGALDRLVDAIDTTAAPRSGRRLQLALPRPGRADRRRGARRHRPRWSTLPGRPVRSSATPTAGSSSEASVPAVRVPGLRPGRRRTRPAERRPGDGHAVVARERPPPHRARRPRPAVVDLRQGGRAPGPGSRGPGQPLPAPSRLPQLLRRLGHRPIRTATRSVDLDEVDSVEVVESGPLRAGIRVTRSFGGSGPHPGHPARRRVALRRVRHRGRVARDQPAPQGGVPRRRPQPPGHLRDPVRPRGAARPTPTPAGTSPASRSAPTSGPTCPSPATGWPCSTTASTATTSPATSSGSRCCAPRPGPIPVADRGHHRFTLPPAPPRRGPPPGRGDRCRLRPQRAHPDGAPPLPTPGRLEPDGSLLSVDADHVVVEAVKQSRRPTRRAGGPALRRLGTARPGHRSRPLEAPSGRPHRPPGAGAGRACPFDDYTVTFDIAPFEIVTLLLEPADG